MINIEFLGWCMHGSFSSEKHLLNVKFNNHKCELSDGVVHHFFHFDKDWSSFPMFESIMVC